MNGQRIVGIVLLVIGIGLLITGLESRHSLADQAHDLIFGRYTRDTAIYIFGGAALAIIGLLTTLFTSNKK